MHKQTFKYIREGLIGLKSDHGIEFEVYFGDSTDAKEIYLDGIDFQPTDDRLSGLFIAIDQKPVMLADLVPEAERQYAVMLREGAAEARAERLHVKSMMDSARYV